MRCALTFLGRIFGGWEVSGYQFYWSAQNFSGFPLVPPLTMTVLVINWLWPQSENILLIPQWDLYSREKGRLLDYVNCYYFGGEAGSN